MIAMREWMLPLICSAIIVVIQIIFAPILTIFSVVPSFIVAFVLVLSVLRRAGFNVWVRICVGSHCGFALSNACGIDVAFAFSNNLCPFTRL